jgi:hypothetical protein
MKSSAATLKPLKHVSFCDLYVSCQIQMRLVLSVRNSFYYSFLFLHGWTDLVGLALLYEFARSLSDTPHSVRLLWTSDQHVAETSTWQHSTHNRPTSMPPAGLETAIPASERPQTQALDREDPGIGPLLPYSLRLRQLFQAFIIYYLYQQMHTHTHTYIKILNYITNAPTCFSFSALSSESFDIAFAKVVKYYNYWNHIKQ